jgi:hypothetical protein
LVCWKEGVERIRFFFRPTHFKIARIEGLLPGGGAGGRHRRTPGTRTSGSRVEEVEEVVEEVEEVEAAAAAAPPPTSSSTSAIFVSLLPRGIPASSSSGTSSSTHRTSSSTPKGGTMAQRRRIAPAIALRVLIEKIEFFLPRFFPPSKVGGKRKKFISFPSLASKQNCCERGAFRFAISSLFLSLFLC